MQHLTRELIALYPQGPLLRGTRRMGGVRHPWTHNGIRCRSKRLREKVMRLRAQVKAPEQRKKIHDLSGVTAYILQHSFTTGPCQCDSRQCFPPPRDCKSWRRRRAVAGQLHGLSTPSSAHSHDGPMAGSALFCERRGLICRSVKTKRRETAEKVFPFKFFEEYK